MTDRNSEFDFPAAWWPSPGDVLKGTVSEIDVITGEYGGYPCVTVDGDDRVAVHAFHTVLRNELAKRNVQVGDQIEILYGGKSGPKATDYERYRVKNLIRQPKEFDWGAGRDPDDSTDAAVFEPEVPADDADLRERAGESDDVPF
jgi:hypothetical protein